MKPVSLWSMALAASTGRSHWLDNRQRQVEPDSEAGSSALFGFSFIPVAKVGDGVGAASHDKRQAIRRQLALRFNGILVRQRFLRLTSPASLQEAAALPQASATSRDAKATYRAQQLRMPLIRRSERYLNGPTT